MLSRSPECRAVVGEANRSLGSAGCAGLTTRLMTRQFTASKCDWKKKRFTWTTYINAESSLIFSGVFFTFLQKKTFNLKMCFSIFFPDIYFQERQRRNRKGTTKAQQIHGVLRSKSTSTDLPAGWKHRMALHQLEVSEEVFDKYFVITVRPVHVE